MLQLVRALLCLLLVPVVLHAQTVMSDTSSVSVLLARADSVWRAERHTEALALYDSVLARQPRSSLATYRRATLLSYRDRLNDAIGAFRRYVELEPRDEEGRIALARTLAWAARYDESVALYDSVRSRDATHRDAVLGAAQALAWASRFRESIARYEDWLRRNPRDDEARLALARTLSWSGRLEDAERIYREVATRGGTEADKGIARILGWRGALAESEAQWREITTRTPRDPEAWTGLAQVLRWQGRPEEAEAALRQALVVQPGYPDARSQLTWVLAELRPSAEPSVSTTTDSDRNRSTLYSLVTGMQAPWRGRLSLAGSHRVAGFPGVEARATVIRGIATWSDRTSRVLMRGELGAEAMRATRGSEIPVRNDALLATGRLAVRPTTRTAVGVTVSRTPFDETAILIERGIELTSAGVDAETALPYRLSLSGAAEVARITGGVTPNQRRAASAALRWNQSRRLSFAIAARAFGYDSTTRDGYFAPERYSLMESSARLQLGPEVGWSGGLDAAVGNQTLRMSGGDASSRLAERARGWITWRPIPGYEATGSIGWANVASPGQVGRGEYSATTLSIAGRIRMW
jgi:tetratricopeptide (TPR) repeat protein